MNKPMMVDVTAGITHEVGAADDVLKNLPTDKSQYRDAKHYPDVVEALNRLTREILTAAAGVPLITGSDDPGVRGAQFDYWPSSPVSEYVAVCVSHLRGASGKLKDGKLDPYRGESTAVAAGLLNGLIGKLTSSVRRALADELRELSADNPKVMILAAGQLSDALSQLTQSQKRG